MPHLGQRRMLTSMIKRGVCSVPSSGTGRLFDGVAALLGISGYNGFESQAAMALESCANQVNTDRSDNELLNSPLYENRHWCYSSLWY